MLLSVGAVESQTPSLRADQPRSGEKNAAVEGPKLGSLLNWEAWENLTDDENL